jgi:hypothetical protein
MNTPYVKKFDENGQVTNPIKGAYINPFPNRHKRRFMSGLSKQAPSSTKIARSSADDHKVIRTGKHLKQPENNYLKNLKPIPIVSKFKKEEKSN